MHFKFATTICLIGVTSILALPSRESYAAKLARDDTDPLIGDPTGKNMCGEINKDIWLRYDVGAWLQNYGIALQPFWRGFFQSIEALQPKVANLDCGSQINSASLPVCSINISNDECAFAPYATVALTAMRNFNNFMSSAYDSISTAGAHVIGLTDDMVSKYNPSATADADSGLKMAGTVIGLIGTLAGVVPVLGPAGAAIGTFGGIMAAVGDVDKPDDPSFGTSGTLKARVQRNVDAAHTALSTFTHHALWDIPSAAADGSGAINIYAHDPNELPSLLAGGAFAGVIDGAKIDSTSIVRSLAAPVINQLWNSEKIIVVKATGAKLGIDPCPDVATNPSIFDNGHKHCNVAHGTMYVLQKWHDLLDNFDDLSAGAVPGFDDAWTDHNINTETVALSSEANQAGGSYFASPPDFDAGVQHFLSTDLSNPPPFSQVFFNLPVCDLDAVTLDKNAFSGCGTPECRFQILMICGCRGHSYSLTDAILNNNLNDNPFPYDFNSDICGDIMVDPCVAGGNC